MKHPIILSITSVLATLTLAACPRSTPEEAAAGARGEAPAEQGHGHGEEERSDLDRPARELFAATCEHGLSTHACDTCRYEVGVVKASPELFERGLLATERPRREAIGEPLLLTGEVQFDQRRIAHVSTQVEGTVRSVYVNLGDEVSRGERLVEIESVAVGEAQADYLAARGLMELARKNQARKAALREEGITSERELLEAEQELEVARIRAETALGTLTRLGMSERVARALTRSGVSGRLVLRAPMGGTLLEIHAVSGEVARAKTSLVTVGSSTAVWVWADVYERDIARVTRGQKTQPIEAAVEVKAFPGKRFSGVVDFISPAMRRASRTASLRIAVPNPDQALLAGMFATIELHLPGEESGLTLPRCAVLEDEGRSFVFVHHQGDYYLRRPVEPGRSSGGRVEIRAGLEGDERVVTEGAFLLKSDVLRSKMGAGCAD